MPAEYLTHMQNMTVVKTDVRWGTLGLCHLIAFFGSGSSGIPMDFCSARNSGSANIRPDFRHSSRSVLKSWCLNLIGFSIEPRGASLSVAMLSVNVQQNSPKQIKKSVSTRCLNIVIRAHPPQQVRTDSERLPDSAKPEKVCGAPGAVESWSRSNDTVPTASLISPNLLSIITKILSGQKEAKDAISLQEKRQNNWTTATDLPAPAFTRILKNKNKMF